MVFDLTRLYATHPSIYTFNFTLGMKMSLISFLANSTNTHYMSSPVNIPMYSFNRTTEKTVQFVKKNLKYKRSLPPLLSHSNKLEELMSRVDINDNSTGIYNDPQSNKIPKPLQGLQGSDFYPEVLTDAKKTMDQILTKLQEPNQAEQEKNWEDLAKVLQVVHEYQRSQYSDSRSINMMETSLKSLAHFFSGNSITTKSQFLTFKNWVSILSFSLSDSINFNDLTRARVYLVKLDEVLSSSNKEIQGLVHSHSNVLFTYQFMERCLDNGCIVKNKLFAVIEKTFNLCGKLKEESEYYFIRNALMSFEKILQTTGKPFKNEIVYQLEQGFERLFQKLIPEEKVIVKRLSYLTIKAIEQQNLTSLSRFCEKTTIEDIYPYQKEIPIGNMMVNVTSALDWGHDLMKQISKELQETYSYFIGEFGEVLRVTGREGFKCDLYIAESKRLYEVFNYQLLGKSTGNGGVTECRWKERSCIPAAAMYRQNNEIWNLRHEFNHILLHLNAGLRVNNPMDKFGRYGRLDWLNEGLSYVLDPNSFMKESIKETLIERGLPSIKDIIEASSQNYAISYSLVDYLLSKQKLTLDKILIYTKDGEEGPLKKELENLISLEQDYCTYLMARWSLPESMRRSTPTKPLPLTTIHTQSTLSDHLSSRTIATLTNAEQTITDNPEDIRPMGWTPEKGSDAIKRVTYGSIVPFGIAVSFLAYAVFGMSEQKGGNGRNCRNHFKAKNRQGDPCEAKPLNRNRNQKMFHKSDTRSSQRNTRV